MAEMFVRVVIYHGNEVVMTQATENAIPSENVPKVARLLMDILYLRLDDQVDIAKLRAHRRQMRATRRKQAVRQVETPVVEGAGE